MTPTATISRYFSRMGKKGAASLNSQLTPKQRKAAARKAANARWNRPKKTAK